MSADVVYDTTMDIEMTRGRSRQAAVFQIELPTGVL